MQIISLSISRSLSISLCSPWYYYATLCRRSLGAFYIMVVLGGHATTYFYCCCMLPYTLLLLYRVVTRHIYDIHTPPVLFGMKRIDSSSSVIVVPTSFFFFRSTHTHYLCMARLVVYDPPYLMFQGGIIYHNTWSRRGKTKKVFSLIPPAHTGTTAHTVVPPLSLSARVCDGVFSMIRQIYQSTSRPG